MVDLSEYSLPVFDHLGNPDGMCKPGEIQADSGWTKLYDVPGGPVSGYQKPDPGRTLTPKAPLYPDPPPTLKGTLLHREKSIPTPSLSEMPDPWETKETELIRGAPRPKVTPVSE